MSATETIQVRVDHSTKEQATQILENLRINMSEAIKMYLQQIILNKGIPFEIKVPTRAALKTMRKVDKGKGLREVANADELMKELNR
jgi:DNA-damage-inducible protein J